MVFPTTSESGFENETRLGWEAQLRYTFSRFSLGAGYQQATVYKFASGDFTGAISTIFVEPRYVFAAAQRTAFYAAGRVGADCCSVTRSRTAPSRSGAGVRWRRRAAGPAGYPVSIDLGASSSRRVTPWRPARRPLPATSWPAWA